MNDPIGQLGALSRVGIIFTDVQRDMIANMMKVGDVAGAQQVILKELQSEFGGSGKALGETFGGDINKMKNQLELMTRQMAESLMPVMKSLVGSVTGLAKAFGSLPEEMQGTIVKLGIFLAVVGPVTEGDRKSTRLNSSHIPLSRMPSSA